MSTISNPLLATLTHGRSLVIDDLSSAASARLEPLAFFYCARNPSESARGDCRDIVCCLLRQLLYLESSLPIEESPIMTSLRDTYNKLKKSGLRKLPLSEATQRIIELTETYPGIVIIIDAIEECDSKARWELLDTLEVIFSRSENPVKVFLSSRSHEDIASQLQDWPKILIKKDDNAKDIERFIDHQVKQAITSRRILRGRISDELNEHLVATLTKGAQGM